MNPPPAAVATLTLNPCLDVSYEFDRLVPDQKVHADHTRFDPGGNGVNVGRALKTLGLPATNHCILAGEIGRLVKRLLDGHLDQLLEVSIAGETRVNCTLLEKKTPAQYEVNGVGPDVPPEALERVSNRFLDAAQGGYGVLTGSLPGGVNDQVYGDLVVQLRERRARAVVDTRGPALAHAVSLGPFLIKPNRYELELYCRRPLPKIEDVVAEARNIQRQGVTYVCVSLGDVGAILVGPENSYYAAAPRVEVRSTVGAGDSLVAGLVAAFARGQDAASALRLGVCCGTGTVTKPGTELFTREDIHRLADKVTLEVF